MHTPRHRVALDEVRSEHLRQAALRRAAPQIHLKQAIFGLHESLGGEQIASRLRIDVRHPPAIAHDARTGAESPAIASVPDTCGVSGGGVSGLRVHASEPQRHSEISHSGTETQRFLFLKIPFSVIPCLGGKAFFPVPPWLCGKVPFSVPPWLCTGS